MKSSPIQLRTWLAVLTGVSAFAITQPIFDLLGDSPEFLSLHDVTALDLVLLIVLLCALLPSLFWLCILLPTQVFPTAIRSRLRSVGFAIVTVLLGAATLRPMLDRVVGWGASLQILGCVILSLCIVVGAARLHRARRHWALVALASPLSAAAFLLQDGPRSILASIGGANLASGINLSSVSPADSQTPVVFIVFDEFPVISLMGESDEIEASLFPNFDLLAKNATWYRNALSVSPATVRSIPAMLTGRYPAVSDVPNLSTHPNNLFTWLSSSHTVHSFERRTRLNPAGARPGWRQRASLLYSDVRWLYLHLLLPEEMRKGLPAVNQDWRGFAEGIGSLASQDDTTRSFERETIPKDFVELLNDEDPAGCFFLHLMLPHSPFSYLPSGRRYTPSTVYYRPYGSTPWAREELLAEHGQRRHLLQAATADRILGDIMMALKTRGLYEKALIVVSADHGISFVPGRDPRDPTPDNLGDIVPVPLLIKLPFQEAGAIDDRAVPSVDIMPTVAAALGTRLPYPVDGRNLLEANYKGIEQISYQAGDKIVDKDVSEILQQREESLLRKRRRFGVDAGSPTLYASGRGFELYGQAIPDSLRESSSFQLLVDPGIEQFSVGPSAKTLATEVVGFMRAELSADQQILILLDDRVRATARPFSRRSGALEGFFTAMLAEELLTVGEHRVDIIVADWSGPRVRFYDTGDLDYEFEGLDLLSNPLAQLERVGFYGLEDWNGTDTGWTGDHASFQFSGMRELDAIELAITIGALPPGGSDLQLKIDGEVVLAERIGEVPWSSVVDLAGRPLGEEFLIELVTNSFVPAHLDEANRDKRVLGVALQELRLRARARD